MDNGLMKLLEARRLPLDEARQAAYEVATTHPLFKDKYYYRSFDKKWTPNPSVTTVRQTIDLMISRIKQSAKQARGRRMHQH